MTFHHLGIGCPVFKVFKNDFLNLDSNLSLPGNVPLPDDTVLFPCQFQVHLEWPVTPDGQVVAVVGNYPVIYPVWGTQCHTVFLFPKIFNFCYFFSRGLGDSLKISAYMVPIGTKSFLSFLSTNSPKRIVLKSTTIFFPSTLLRPRMCLWDPRNPQLSK